MSTVELAKSRTLRREQKGRKSYEALLIPYIDFLLSLFIVKK
jgi:hypothetical protein